MDKTIMTEKGKLYNLTLDGKKLLRGWLLLITEEGEEFLVKRNLSIGAKVPWRIYRTDYQFKGQCLAATSLQYSKANKYGLALAIPISAFIRAVIPSTYFFGEVNKSMNLMQGIMNILFIIPWIVLSIAYLIFYRHQRLKCFLKTQHANLNYVGKLTLGSPIKIQKNGMGFW